MSPSSYTLEEAVAQYIGQFPSEYLLQRAQTKDQQEYWGHLAALSFNGFPVLAGKA
jgi:hypothetical protein